jgi:hypothetical protein
MAPKHGTVVWPTVAKLILYAHHYAQMGYKMPEKPVPIVHKILYQHDHVCPHLSMVCVTIRFRELAQLALQTTPHYLYLVAPTAHGSVLVSALLLPMQAVATPPLEH